jgi:hypothetical protein
MKKGNLMVFLVALVVCLTTSVVSAAPPSFTGTITGDMTLNVPADFADINAALSYLSDKRIADTAIVTIKVADGTYNYTNQITVKHSDGKQINIIGNVENPESCVINFSANGIVVSNGCSLGYLNGFKFCGVNTVETIGVFAINNSHIDCGSKMILYNFYDGVYASQNASISANGVTATNCWRGFCAMFNAYVLAIDSFAYNNRYGYVAARVSDIYARGYTVAGNTNDFYPSGNSIIDTSN